MIPQSKVALLSHPDCLRHNLGPGHPEQPGRITAIENALLQSGLWPNLVHVQPDAASRAALARVHPQSHLDNLINATPRSGVNWLDPDTGLSPPSWDAALYAAGAGIRAVDDILAGTYRRAFCNIRPPGHHAGSARAMGFCLLNNVAIAVVHALAQPGVEKAAILDFDVHHGNGTEQIFNGDERVLLVSSFQHPLYPHTGTEPHPGYVPIPLPAGTAGGSFRQAWRELGLPALESFKPDFVFISAGFDGHRDDPLAGLNLLEEDYAWLTSEICRIADLSQGRVVSMLEGGYDLDALGRSAVAHIRALLND